MQNEERALGYEVKQGWVPELWASDLPFLDFSFVTCKMEKVTSWGHSLWGPDKGMDIKHQPSTHPITTAAAKFLLPDR